ncbi:MAG: hypothetical protein ACWA40_06495 [Planktomarina sp.]
MGSNRLVQLQSQDELLKDMRLELDRLQTQVASLTQVVTEQKRRMETEFVPVSEAQNLTAQVAAMNSSLVDEQKETELMRRRWQDSHRIYTDFFEHCQAVPECARAMGIEN